MLVYQFGLRRVFSLLLLLSSFIGDGRIHRLRECYLNQFTVNHNTWVLFSRGFPSFL